MSTSHMYRLPSYDVVVVGSGHAGCEAGLAAARMGCRTLIISPNLDRVGYMPCNPSIGGPGKSQIVSEIDALGGAMAIAADMTAMQVRQLNTSKGPAVRATRVQCDKTLYGVAMKQIVERQPNLELMQDEAVGLLIAGQGSPQVEGVLARSSGAIVAKAVIITAGTFLRARMIAGEDRSHGGRAGDTADSRLSGSLAELGLGLRRFKTGTPPRIDVRSIDISRTEPQFGDDTPLWLSRDGREGRLRPLALPAPIAGPFSDVQVRGERLQVPCYQTWTNDAAHEVIRRNLHRAPMYNGSIEGTGPRYCPSIEDKVGRFLDKSSHPIFIEPEGWMSGEVYIQGMSTSLPQDVQAEVLRHIPGLERGRITRFGYAVEYDALDARSLTHGLECRHIGGLFFAGQVNGTSGYEEAAGQGLIAGANAGARVKSLPPLTMARSDGYIGVMIDDLVSLAFDEPYRMLTSRAEYRLLLRSDTADARLTPVADRLGLISADRADDVARENRLVDQTLEHLPTLWFGANPKHAAALMAEHIQPANRSLTAMDLVRRPGVSLDSVLSASAALGMLTVDRPSRYALDRAEIAAKYGSFIEKEQREVARYASSESWAIPPDLDFTVVKGLRVEARQKLQAARPTTIGQAGRTAGVTPTDIGALLVHLSLAERTRHRTPQPAAV
ncbi:MAG TPA: FAD-dependent oxidoreductase [Thermomicrobiales bacterium]|nr:FAD-dependent oxidoreductase [Thermomicrobiales bacterium]